MNTLKKGDKCQSPWGVVTIREVIKDSDIVTIHRDELTRIPSHAERMQAVLDVAWDVENRLEPHETVQLTVGEFVEFARHFVKMQDLLEMQEIDRLQLAEQCRQNAKKIENLLKGETL